jgi:uncharacterized protein YjiS (DUF1127 family)
MMSTIDTIRGSQHGGPTAAADFGVLRAAAAIVGWLVAMADRRRGRRLLLEMSDAQLKDIGISRADAYREAKRPIWK